MTKPNRPAIIIATTRTICINRASSNRRKHRRLTSSASHNAECKPCYHLR
jgi:hypothetical protein